MNPEAEKVAAAVGLTYWEYLVIKHVAEHGKMLASSGSSALFDAGWALERRGLLKTEYVGERLVYLVMNTTGKEVFERLKKVDL